MSFQLKIIWIFINPEEGMGNDKSYIIRKVRNKYSKSTSRECLKTTATVDPSPIIDWSLLLNMGQWRRGRGFLEGCLMLVYSWLKLRYPCSAAHYSGLRLWSEDFPPVLESPIVEYNIHSIQAQFV